MKMKITLSKRISIIDSYQNIIIKGIENNTDNDSYSLIYTVQNGVNEHKVLLSYHTQLTIINYLINNNLTKYYEIVKCADNADMTINFADLAKDKVVFKNIFIGKMKSKKDKDYVALLLNDNDDDMLNHCEQEPEQSL